MKKVLSDELLLKVVSAWLQQPEGELHEICGEPTIQYRLAAMRAVLGGQIIILNAPDGKCPECRYSIDKHHVNCPIGRIVASDLSREENE